jgi:(2Fe-2S) ferredoxin
MSYFDRHVFVCTNARQDACKKSCNDHGEGTQAAKFLKNEVAKRALNGKGHIRISQAGCLGRCQEGPALVIYPEGHWYTYQTEQDLLQILEEDLINQRQVTSLSLD